MKSLQPAVPSLSSLTQLIRRSRALDPALKRHWLAILAELSPDHRARLYDLLSAKEASELASFSPQRRPKAPGETPRT